MKKIIPFRPLISWFLLLVTIGALVAGLKEGIRNVQSAEFLSVAAFAATLSYVLGSGKWTTRRAWIIISISGLLLIFAESARLIEPLKIIIRAIPQFELGFLRWFFQKENTEILFPDTSIIQSQFAQLATKAGAFTSRLFNGSMKDSSIREFIWDMPLLFISAWAGWGISRRNQVLLALLPALTVHAYILYYADKSIFSLQIHVFAFILLLGIHQKWNSSAVEKNEKAARETHYTLVILSIAIAALAGLAPSISIRSAAQRLTQSSDLAKSLGLERESPRIYISRGLPRQHLINQEAAFSKKIVFTVKTGELPAFENSISIKEAEETAPRHYWRWLTYDVYKGSGWTSSPVENRSYTAAQALISPSNLQYQIIHQQVEKSSAKDNRLYWTGSLLAANESFNASWRTSPDDNPLAADMLGAIMETQIYQADSLIPVTSISELRAAPQEYSKEIQQYLLLTTPIPQRVLDLARELTKGLTNPYDKAKAIETYLRTYPYSLQVPPPPQNQDIADYFLFDLKTGYCDYYATSMIVLARATGLPARLVVGYSSGIYNPRKAEYTIREENAHSWVEIYFTRIGWVEFEPTANQPPIILPEKLPGKNDITHKILSTSQTGYANSTFRKNTYLLTFAFISVILLVLIVWFLYVQGLLRAHKTIYAIYQYIFYHGKKIYKGTSLNETPSIFAEKLKSKIKTGDQWLNPARDEIEFLTGLYLQEMYSAHPVTKDEREVAQKTWRKLFWRLLYARVINFSGSPSHID